MSRRCYSLAVLARLLGTTGYVGSATAKKLGQDAKAQRLPAKRVAVVNGRYPYVYAADVSSITRYLRLPKEAEWIVEKGLILALEELGYSHPVAFAVQERIDKELNQ